MKPLKVLNASVTVSNQSQETSSSTNAATTSPPTHTSNTSSWESSTRPIQNFRLVWLDSTINKINNSDYSNTITKLRQVVNTVTQFADIDECIDFVSDIDDEKIFVICSGELGQTTVSVCHYMAQVNCFYIFC